MIHFVVIIIIIIAIALCQIYFSKNTYEKLKSFITIFPDDQNQISRGVVGSDDGSTVVITTRHDNPVLKIIINSINTYLIKNSKAISDFHLMKDIVDRNCDALEEEIQTQVPIPLYFGLMGTMTGILIGIVYLWLSGGLNDLLNSGSSAGAEGVQALLGGIALAMISNITGIILTTLNSLKTKDAKTIVEKNKHTFLSWVQAELLPELSNDFTSVIEKVTRNLGEFNSVFAKNTDKLQATLGQVNESYHSQVELMKTINELKIKKIALANVEVYEKLKNCTDEIGLLGIYLKDIRDHIDGLHEVTTNINTCFKKELEQIDERKGYVSRAVGSVDATLQDAIQRLTNSSVEQCNGFIKLVGEQDDGIKRVVVSQRETMVDAVKIFDKTVAEQQRALQNKLDETSKIVDELQNLTAIKTSMKNIENAVKTVNKDVNDELHNLSGMKIGISSLEKATTVQNIRIERLAETVERLGERLIQMKSSTTNATSGSRPVSIMPSIPRWLKISTVSSLGLVSASCILYIAPFVANWIPHILHWIFNA